MTAAPALAGMGWTAGAEAPRPLSAADRRRVDRLLGLWEHLVDPRLGIIREVKALPVDDDEPDFFHFLSYACDTARFTALSNFGNNGGVSTNAHLALAKAIGEGIERYCSAIFRYQELVLAPYRALDRRATPPEAFALYLPEQHEDATLPWRPFTAESTVSWTAGTSLLGGEGVLVPAAMVYVPFHFQRATGDTPICQPISTGLAAGCSYAEAALSGLCEAVERDAFTITWQARLSRPRLSPESLPASVAALVRRFAAVDIDVALMDITTDIRIPTVMAVALSDVPTSPAVAVAAATDPSPVRAAVKCLEELAHTRKFARQVLQYAPPLPVEVAAGHPQVQDQQNHLRFYCPQEAKAFAEFAWSSAEWRDLAELPDLSAATPEAELAAAAQAVRAAGLDAVACDLTSPDVAPLGLFAVRVVVPGLHPLQMGHQNRARGGRRLYEVPQRLGYRGLQPGAADNPYPHPFP